MEMTEKQEKVYLKLKELSEGEERPVSPTEVGMALGYKYGEASPHCTSGINKALRLGLIRRVSRGQYEPVKRLNGEHKEGKKKEILDI